MSKKGLGKFVLGAGIGAGLALLFAPKKGSDLRRDIKRKFDEFMKDVDKIEIEDIKESFTKKVDEIKKEQEDLDKEKEEKISGILDICQSTVCPFPAGARRAGLLCPWRICLRGEQHPQGSGQSGTEFDGGDVPEIPHKRCVCG